MTSLIFLRNQDNIDVTYVSTLRDANNLDENFTVHKTVGLDNPKELQLFYWITKGFRWTLNEMIFFAICNDMCLQVRDESGNLLNAFGTCGNVPTPGDFNYDYNNDYFV